MKVLVYVEGPSDRDALRALLRSVLAEGQRRRIGIQFLPLGDKAKILDTSAGKAARHLAEHPEDWVIALPDLYPMAQYDSTPNEHRSFADLERLLTERFAREARRRRVTAQAQARFRVHCLKHDLEVLLLAYPDQLRQRLGTDHALGQWRSPVEDQNDQQPPKRVVEALFKKYRPKGYIETVMLPGSSSGRRSKRSLRNASRTSRRSWRNCSGSSQPAAVLDSRLSSGLFAGGSGPYPYSSSSSMPNSAAMRSSTDSNGSARTTSASPAVRTTR